MEFIYNNTQYYWVLFSILTILLKKVVRLKIQWSKSVFLQNHWCVWILTKDQEFFTSSNDEAGLGAYSYHENPDS